MKRNPTLYLTRGALIAAMYVALTYVAALFGLSSGAIQFRLSEMLCILPFFIPEATVGLAVGCLISNILTGCYFWDVIFGTVATLIGALGAQMLRRIPKKLTFVATIPTVLSNAIIVPLVLIYTYGATEAYPFLMLTVGIGEIVCAGIMGSVLGYTLHKTAFFKKQE